MTTSCVSLRGKGFWSPDSLLEVFAYFLAEELKKSSSLWAREYARNLQIQSTAGMIGCIEFQLETLSEEALHAVSHAAEIAVAALGRDPPTLSGVSLTALRLGGGSTFGSDVEFNS